MVVRYMPELTLESSLIVRVIRMPVSGHLYAHLTANTLRFPSSAAAPMPKETKTCPLG